ncbi:hypothetical protein ACFQZX_04735 [Mucilaginibacter litoreus]|uniref:Lipoprotein n=1 Tax=Mucilaginibacter litoreus TaxID=1048221 RepID=A0ABW3APJ9_9SPHI
MKNNIIKLMAIIVISTAALTSCSIENRGNRGGHRYDRDRYDNRYNNHDRYDHHDGYYNHH